MIPTWIKTEQIATKVVKQPSKTYHLDLQRGRDKAGNNKNNAY